MVKAAIGAFCLFVAILFKGAFFDYDIYDLKKAKEFHKKRAFEKVFLIPNRKFSQIASFDKKLFASRMLDNISIANREFLLISGWRELALSALWFNPKSLNTLIITAYQYMSGKNERDFSNFYFIDDIIRKHIDVAKKDWQLMMIMGYWWQFKLKSLKGAEIYAKALFENKEASIAVRETYPIILSKLNEKKKAIEFYKVLLKHTKKEEERRWIKNQIKHLQSQ